MSVECPFYIELERTTRSPKLADKLQRYSGHWLREIETPPGRFELRPIVVVHHDTRPAKRRRPGSGAQTLRENVGSRLYPPGAREGADDRGAPGGNFAALMDALREHNPHADPGRMILMCSWEDMLRFGPYNCDYYPVAGYDEDLGGVHDDGWTIDLPAAARERAVMVEMFDEAMGRKAG